MDSESRISEANAILKNIAELELDLVEARGKVKDIRDLIKSQAELLRDVITGQKTAMFPEMHADK